MRLTISALKEMIRDELAHALLQEDNPGGTAYPGRAGTPVSTGASDAYAVAGLQDVESQEHPDDPTDPAEAEKQKELRRQATQIEKTRGSDPAVAG